MASAPLPGLFLSPAQPSPAPCSCPLPITSRARAPHYHPPVKDTSQSCLFLALNLIKGILEGKQAHWPPQPSSSTPLLPASPPMPLTETWAGEQTPQAACTLTVSLVDGGFPVDVALAGCWERRKGRKKGRRTDREVSASLWRADGMEALQMLPHVSFQHAAASSSRCLTGPRLAP